MKIYRVSSVRVHSFPIGRSWLVMTLGQTSSGGWTNPRLVRAEDESGLAVFSFEADKPRGPATDVLMPIAAITIFQPDRGTKGVKVVAETNAIVRLPDFIRAHEDGTDETDFLPFEHDVDDEDFDAEAIEVFNRQQDARRAEHGPASKCETKDLLRVPTRVEFKTEGWKLYRRTRYNVTYLEYCYPTDLGQEAEEAVKKCLPAAVVAGVAAFAAGGPSAAVAAFIASLKACVGAELAGKVSVRIRNREEIGRWHRV